MSILIAEDLGITRLDQINQRAGDGSGRTPAERASNGE